MKNLLYGILLSVFTTTYAQENMNGITLGAHIPEQAETIPAGAKRLLLNKLGKIITENGMSDNVKNSRFILVPNVAVLSKNVTPTAPPKIAYTLEVTFYIGDGVAGNLFESESVVAKGVGTNELKAYTAAIKSIKTTNQNIKNLIANGKKEILNYYEAHCSEISDKAASLESRGRIAEALATIVSIPETSSCFKKNQQKISRLYKKSIDEDCSRKLNAAKAIWASNQDLNAANSAGQILASIEPRSKCFSEVEKVYNSIAKRVAEVSDRGWEYQLMELEVDKSEIDAARAIGVAYGVNQAQNITYNTRGWY